jgi:hypothetical protein
MAEVESSLTQVHTLRLLTYARQTVERLNAHGYQP